MLLLVAMTKTGTVFSCNHTKKLLNTRAEVPASDRCELAVPASPFSISSSHNTAGLTVSASRNAERIFSSDEPTIWLKTLPMSRRNKGNCHKWAVALATSDLPPPGTPNNNKPRGSGKPNWRARAPKAICRFFNHPFNSASPPT